MPDNDPTSPRLISGGKEPFLDFTSPPTVQQGVAVVTSALLTEFGGVIESLDSDGLG